MSANKINTDKIMEADKDLKEAVEACGKVIEEKCGKKPYMIVVAKANVMEVIENNERKLKGTTDFMYFSRPPLNADGLSMLLIDTCKLGIEAASKKLSEE